SRALRRNARGEILPDRLRQEIDATKRAREVVDRVAVSATDVASVDVEPSIRRGRAEARDPFGENGPGDARDVLRFCVVGSCHRCAEEEKKGDGPSCALASAARRMGTWGAHGSSRMVSIEGWWKRCLRMQINERAGTSRGACGRARR